jgi:hypothetical protein
MGYYWFCIKYGVVLCFKVINDELNVGVTIDSIGGIQAIDLQSGITFLGGMYMIFPLLTQIILMIIM